MLTIDSPLTHSRLVNGQDHPPYLSISFQARSNDGCSFVSSPLACPLRFTGGSPSNWTGKHCNQKPKARSKAL
jgi:hypothetical protein